MVESFFHYGAIAQRTAGIGHQQGWMHALGSAEASAGAAGAGRIVKSEVRVMKRRRKQVMFGAAKVLPEALESRTGDAFRMKREEAVANFQTMLKRSQHLAIDSRLNHKT